jgi:hypothetical protein
VVYGIVVGHNQKARLGSHSGTGQDIEPGDGVAFAVLERRLEALGLRSPAGGTEEIDEVFLRFLMLNSMERGVTWLG